MAETQVKLQRRGVGRPKLNPQTKAFRQACRDFCDEGMRQAVELLKAKKLKPREMLDMLKWASAYGHGSPPAMGADLEDPATQFADLPAETQLVRLRDRVKDYEKAIAKLEKAA